jgi:hypothetical protein
VETFGNHDRRRGNGGALSATPAIAFGVVHLRHRDRASRRQAPPIDSLIARSKMTQLDSVEYITGDANV